MNYKLLIIIIIISYFWCLCVCSISLSCCSLLSPLGTATKYYYSESDSGNTKSAVIMSLDGTNIYMYGKDYMYGTWNKTTGAITNINFLGKPISGMTLTLKIDQKSDQLIFTDGSGQSHTMINCVSVPDLIGNWYGGNIDINLNNDMSVTGTLPGVQNGSDKIEKLQYTYYTPTGFYQPPGIVAEYTFDKNSMLLTITINQHSTLLKKK